MATISDLALSLLSCSGAKIVEKSAQSAKVIVGGKEIDCVFCKDLAEPINGFIFCDNTKDNVERLVNAWDAFIAKPLCKITFITTSNGNKWSIKPSIHDKIVERKNLKLGLLSLFDGSLA
ncbi:MAG TPA: hypothetical protein VK158_05825 [Acidobacteriota bacterium]|nr:hypothetical protein [Acidobacteriota bacterium]